MPYLGKAIRAAIILTILFALPVFSSADELPVWVQAAEDKEILVAANMNLTESEAQGFWPVYDAYQTDLNAINVRLVNLLNEYALNYRKGAVLDYRARQLIDESIAIDMDEVKLKQSYVPKLAKVLPDAKVARYIQIENKIRASVRYDLSSYIPLAR
jgi:lipase chaperone LimK